MALASQPDPVAAGHLNNKKGQQTVLGRLNRLFPSQPNITNNKRPTDKGKTCSSHSAKFSTIDTSTKGSSGGPKFLKVKIVSWNMHDSVPKGDLEALFGKIPLYNVLNTDSTSFPHLPHDDNHPFHFIVVAGQECPSLSGIPMGLGAGFKIIDKDREKEREGREFPKGNDREEPMRSWSKKQKDSRGRGTGAQDDETGLSGWTSMLEDYLCQGGGSGIRRSPKVSDVGYPQPLAGRLSSKEPRKGLYQFLVKDRLMGIYLAVYIHRDLRALVQGISKSAVATGLIGGRVGNKGGVGISVNLDGTTLLFLNAHLAAHEDKVNHRIANLAKIKAELSVDDFLHENDPRKHAEDLTDKFDYTFLFGDLNFRLDLTRLHADWLISRQEFSQALAFDQLIKVMDSRQAFIGFREGTINFPPTFKYDLVPSNRLKPRADGRKHDDTISNPIGGITEIKLSNVEDEDIEDDFDGGEAMSMASSTWTSNRSKRYDGERDEEVYFHLQPPPTKPLSPSKLSLPTSFHLAKRKWISLVSSRQDQMKKTLIPSHEESPGLKKTAVISSVSLDANYVSRISPKNLVSSIKSYNPGNEEGDSNSPGVYDSSSKRRVPSWCDRILWKSTAKPDSSLDVELHSSRNRVGQFFSNAFRPMSARLREDAPIKNFELGDSSPLSTASRQHHVQDSIVAGTGPSPNRSPWRSSSIPIPPHTAPSPPIRRATAFPLNPSQHQNSNTFAPRWRFFSLLTSTHNDILRETPISAQRLKGEVVCLTYNTLDDRAMQRLKGRSDHRPVIGTYAIYL